MQISITANESEIKNDEIRERKHNYHWVTPGSLIWSFITRFHSVIIG